MVLANIFQWQLIKTNANENNSAPYALWQAGKELKK